MNDLTKHKGLSDEDQARFTAIKQKAKELGVLDINLDGIVTKDIIECYERTFR